MSFTWVTETKPRNLWPRLDEHIKGKDVWIHELNSCLTDRSLRNFSRLVLCFHYGVSQHTSSPLAFSFCPFRHHFRHKGGGSSRTPGIQEWTRFPGVPKSRSTDSGTKRELLNWVVRSVGCGKSDDKIRSTNNVYRYVWSVMTKFSSDRTPLRPSLDLP